MTTETGADRVTLDYRTRGGIAVRRRQRETTYGAAMEPVLDVLDTRRGVLLASSFEYPGRYTRYDIGFVNPPLEFAARGRRFEIRALNDRGEILLPAVAPVLAGNPDVGDVEIDAQSIVGAVDESTQWFPEELRSKQPTVFTVVRELVDLFHSAEDSYLGLYGAFGYELAFQFEAVRTKLERDPAQRNLVLYLPDRIHIVDHRREIALEFDYDFTVTGSSSEGMPRDGASTAYRGAAAVERECDHEPGQYAACVRQAIERFRCGDLFEVVPSQTFFEPCEAPPSEVFRRLKSRNPAPYGALMNLGEGEYLVAASPEMYVRVEGRRIETCPISGTIKRGAGPIADAEQIRRLLNSEKDESELTMCTDVDRNDKSRVCEAGSVKVIGRRQIEMYSRLIHTVDHVEGTLREGFDALDGFLAHTWAVTVTGAPKQHAIQFIEDHEHSPKNWYGGAIGFIGFDGNMNTGLTLRTVRIHNGVAEVRAGATLLFESSPEAEEAETRLKASALLDAIRRADTPVEAPAQRAVYPGEGKRVVIVDHEDSFVHTLAGYFRQTGAEVVTFRAGFPASKLEQAAPDMVLLSPGPGRPRDFRLARTIAAARKLEVPVFGVCLGLQGIVEFFGGSLDVLPRPMHGKASIRVTGGALFEGLPSEFTAGRYHSLFADRDSLPAELAVTALSEEGLVMAVEHESLPIAAVQFHPESIMSLEGDHGLRLVTNVVNRLCAPTSS